MCAPCKRSDLLSGKEGVAGVVGGVVDRLWSSEAGPIQENPPNNSSRAAGPAAIAHARAAAFGCSVRAIALASMILFYL